jgi:hypothetical protein
VKTSLVAVAAISALAISVSGCRFLKKKEDAAPSATVAPVAVPAPPPVATSVAAAAAVAAPAVDPPTAEDFEEEAFEKITQDNFEAELAKLEKEFE